MLFVEFIRRTAIERDEANARVGVEEREKVVRDRMVSVDELSPGASIVEQPSLRINHMRAMMPIATGTWYHVMSFDITQCHDRSVPKMSQRVARTPNSSW
jgi:hypothetical protein